MTYDLERRYFLSLAASALAVGATPIGWPAERAPDQWEIVSQDIWRVIYANRETKMTKIEWTAPFSGTFQEFSLPA